MFLAHIIIKAKEIKREHGLLTQAEKDAATDRFCDRVIAFFKKACDTARKLNSGDISWDSAEGVANCFSKQLSNIRKRPLVFKPTETLRAYLIGPEQKFLLVP